MSKILPHYRRCFYTHSKSAQTLSSRKCAGIVVTYEGLIYHETYNEPWLYTRWRCQIFIPVEKGGKCRNILRELMYMSMTNKGYFWTWPFNFICYKTRPNPFTIQTKIRILTKQSKNTRLQIPLFTKMILENEGDQSYFAGFSRKYVSPRVAFILHYWYFKGSWLLYLKVTGKEYFHDLGGCWGNEEWGSVKGMNLISATEPN